MTEKKDWSILGKRCKDIISGYEGICTSMVEWLYGCTQFGLRSTEQKSIEPSFFYAKQLEVVDDGITDKIEIPEFSKPKYFGMQCRDKITGLSGICTARAVSIYNCDQYAVELTMEDRLKCIWLDEGRIEIVVDEPKIKVEDVQGERIGGVLPDSYYPDVSTDRPRL